MIFYLLYIDLAALENKNGYVPKNAKKPLALFLEQTAQINM